jgi:hypothetical protein
MKRKPKFKVGQVVFLDEEGRYERILDVAPNEDKGGLWEYQVGGGYWWQEPTLRHLTRREMGLRPNAEQERDDFARACMLKLAQAANEVALGKCEHLPSGESILAAVSAEVREEAAKLDAQKEQGE